MKLMKNLHTMNLYRRTCIWGAVYEEAKALAPDLNGLAYSAAVFRDEVVNMYAVTVYGQRSGDADNHYDHVHVSFY